MPETQTRQRTAAVTTGNVSVGTTDLQVFFIAKLSKGKEQREWFLHQVIDLHPPGKDMGWVDGTTGDIRWADDPRFLPWYNQLVLDVSRGYQSVFGFDPETNRDHPLVPQSDAEKIKEVIEATGQHRSREEIIRERAGQLAAYSTNQFVTALREYRWASINTLPQPEQNAIRQNLEQRLTKSYYETLLSAMPQEQSEQLVRQFVGETNAFGLSLPQLSQRRGGRIEYPVDTERQLTEIIEKTGTRLGQDLERTQIGDFNPVHEHQRRAETFNYIQKENVLPPGMAMDLFLAAEAISPPVTAHAAGIRIPQPEEIQQRVRDTAIYQMTPDQAKTMVDSVVRSPTGGGQIGFFQLMADTPFEKTVAPIADAALATLPPKTQEEIREVIVVRAMRQAMEQTDRLTEKVGTGFISSPLFEYLTAKVHESGNTHPSVGAAGTFAGGIVTQILTHPSLTKGPKEDVIYGMLRELDAAGNLQMDPRYTRQLTMTPEEQAWLAEWIKAHPGQIPPKTAPGKKSVAGAAPSAPSLPGYKPGEKPIPRSRQAFGLVFRTDTGETHIITIQQMLLAILANRPEVRDAVIIRYDPNRHGPGLGGFLVSWFGAEAAAKGKNAAMTGIIRLFGAEAAEKAEGGIIHLISAYGLKEGVGLAIKSAGGILSGGLTVALDLGLRLGGKVAGSLVRFASLDWVYGQDSGKNPSLFMLVIILPVAIVIGLFLLTLFSPDSKEFLSMTLADSLTAGEMPGEPWRVGFFSTGKTVNWLYSGNAPVSAITNSPTNGGVITQGPGGSFTHKNANAYDIANADGAPIMATHNAHVVSYLYGIPKNTFQNKSWGNYVLLAALLPGTNTIYYTMYAHLLDVSDAVKKACGIDVDNPPKQVVVQCIAQTSGVPTITAGEVIGWEDATGSTYGANDNGTGTHLHYQYYSTQMTTYYLP